ncbi:hypothetical protein CARUB_v10025305mg [Capsella rubella]|uniref:TF-B3 domain-containing protein n=1 Tax=Capsella rubella TaxID=81985 RepID=R0G1F3_9BRAS|nr:hypothetical protein CARUB_v10025305mg [Capsella rubella]
MATTEACRDKPYDPNHPFNIFITLTPSDTETDTVLVDVYDYDSKVAITLTMKKETDGNFKLYGWNNILEGRKFKTGDRIGFWWDTQFARLNFTLLLVA